MGGILFVVHACTALDEHLSVTGREMRQTGRQMVEFHLKRVCMYGSSSLHDVYMNGDDAIRGPLELSRMRPHLPLSLLNTDKSKKVNK